MRRDVDFFMRELGRTIELLRHMHRQLYCVLRCKNTEKAAYFEEVSNVGLIHVDIGVGGVFGLRSSSASFLVIGEGSIGSITIVYELLNNDYARSSAVSIDLRNLEAAREEVKQTQSNCAIAPLARRRILQMDPDPPFLQHLALSFVKLSFCVSIISAVLIFKGTRNPQQVQ